MKPSWCERNSGVFEWRPFLDTPTRQTRDLVW